MVKTNLPLWGVGGDLVSTLLGRVCREVKDTSAVSEMSDKILVKMGVRFGTSLYMGEDIT